MDNTLYKILCIVFMGFFFLQSSYSQLYYRIEADYSIKEKSTSGYENLMLGKVFYDRNIRQSVYNVKFPEKELLIVNDTCTIKALEGTYEKHLLGTSLLDFSVLSLFINGNLDYFGLDKTPFTLDKVENENGLVISTWNLKNQYVNSSVGKMLLSQKNNKLHGLITFNEKDEVVSKQIFSEYISIENMYFPTKVLQISFLRDGTEMKKITKYSNIILNSIHNEEFYNYRYIPSGK